ncbi:tetratricopeptide repeat protein (macronuclear) [Tetrahymena thermophila SB210]|uniref:Tetratricopeptide repeat protein n=1 Tax=Tetrahymena thermophila (strain SB210) TaxID=312017 RepID=Q22XK7_TETTS|nr:tetratricopeptide repeat protein [Tetrahymena thermophila SB210]EAR90003.2 tetratricopeptide repeat protein [Tetrahymena thermophila SB210]|eukprot:XP_001010248.2 tetratricopeptide repeat protein [Tetrahymena thermophila SB210]
MIEFNKQIDLKKIYLDQKACIPYDITIIIQLEYQSQYSSFESCILNLQNQNFFRKYDRIQILIYDTQLEIFMPFTLISSDHQLNQIINSLRDLGKLFIQVNQKKLKELNWVQAIELSLSCIYEHKYNDFINFKQMLKSVKEGYKNFMRYKHLKIQQNMNEQERKQIIILFSKQQNSQIQSLNINDVYKLVNHQKLIIYHLKEYSLLENQSEQYQTPFLNYESFVDDIPFINQFKQLREEDSLNEENEFIAILNNS